MIQFSCECGRQLQANDEDAGRQTKCPGCGRIQTIPSADAITQDEPRGSRRDRDREDGIQEERPSRRSRDDYEERPRRGREESGTSGKAVAALVLGLLSFPCVIGSVLTGLPAILFGAIALSDIGKSDGRLGGKAMALTGLITGIIGCILLAPAVLIGLMLPAVQKVREAAARTQESNNLKQMALAMHNFNDTNNGFPQAAAFRSPTGEPLLSWRVALLPYIEQQNLYMQFHLDEPWDSPHNKALLTMMPKVYLQPGEKADGSGLTHYQVLVGPGTIFEDPRTMEGRKLPLFLAPRAPLPGLGVMDIPDGMSNTILIATAEKGVPWTKPEDLIYDPKGPLPAFNKRFRVFNVALADGSVRGISQNISEQTLRAAITRNDGMVLGFDW